MSPFQPYQPFIKHYLVKKYVLLHFFTKYCYIKGWYGQNGGIPTMGRYYTLRIYFISSLSRTLKCRKQWPKTQKIWHHFHALYVLRNFTHIYILLNKMQVAVKGNFFTAGALLVSTLLCNVLHWHCISIIERVLLNNNHFVLSWQCSPVC